MIEFWSSSQTHKDLLPRILFLLLILLLPTQFGKHFWPQESFVLGIRIDYLSPTIYFTDILVWSLFLVLVIPLRRTVYHALLSFLRSRLVRLSALLFFVSIIAMIFGAERPSLVFYAVVNIVEIGTVCFCTWWFCRGRSFRNMTVFIFSLGMVFESLLALFQFLGQSSLGGVFYYVGERSFVQTTPGIALSNIGDVLLLRPYGTLPHPNVLAGYLLVGSILTLYVLSDVKKTWQKRWLGGVLLLSFLTVLLSLSRVSIVLFLCVLFVFLFRLEKLSQRFGISLLLGVVMSVIAFGPFLTKRFLDLSLTSETITQRISLMQSAWEIFLSHPVFGVGFSHFLVTLPKVMAQSSTVFLLQPVHNIFLLILSEGGLLLFSSMTLLSVFLIRRVIRLRGQEKLVSVMLLFVLFCVGMVDHYLLTLQQGQLLLGVSLGLILSFTPLKRSV